MRLAPLKNGLSELVVGCVRVGLGYFHSIFVESAHCHVYHLSDVENYNISSFLRVYIKLPLPFWRECEGLDPKIRVIALQFYSPTRWNSRYWIHTSTFLAIIYVASQLLLCLVWTNLRLEIGVYNTLTSKIRVKLLKPPKIQIPMPNTSFRSC